MTHPDNRVTFGPVPSRRLGQSLGIKIAVITNSSLIWHEDVRDELARADWVSLKVEYGEQSFFMRKLSRTPQS